MAVALAERSDLAVHVFHDERSAAFAALGIARASGTPAAVLCTSGTAATHFHAAVVEAHQSGIPMLVLTADRPPELHGVGAPQTIDQLELYGAAVRMFVDAGVADIDERDEWRPLAADVWRRATVHTPGPVHVNLKFREPLLGQPFELPPPVLRSMATDQATLPDLGQVAAAQRGVIVAGDGVDFPQAVSAVARATGWPVLADPMSGCQTLPEAVVRFDAALRDTVFAQRNTPDAWPCRRTGSCPTRTSSPHGRCTHPCRLCVPR
jgi:2-succinyl-5-enolpyruvyl-6-hydroxy-3-cyclohexene-1-carboxylate synthase